VPLFIYGNRSTGKSALIRYLMNYLHPIHAIVHCGECFSQRILFENIVRQLILDGADSCICQNVSSFVSLLRSLNISSIDQTIYLIFDDAEQLRNLDEALLPCLVRLDDLVKTKNICTIFISNLPWESLRNSMIPFDPIPVYFKNYSKEICIEIICRILAEDDENYLENDALDFYRGFVSILVNLIWFYCNDLKELCFVARTLFPIYRNPIDQGKVSEHEKTKLVHAITPYLKYELLERLLMRGLSASDMATFKRNRSGEGTTSKAIERISTPRSTLISELPIVTKYLLVAAYIASYSPAKLDQKLFGNSNIRCGSYPLKKKKLYQLSQSPKSFPLERLFAIFESITTQHLNFSIEIGSQVSTLLNIKLLRQTSLPGTFLDNPKLVCQCGADLIQAIAHSIGFDLSRYLE